MSLERAQSIEHLIKQVEDGLSKGLTCIEPEELQAKWGIPVWGLWRTERKMPQTSYFSPTPPKIEEIAARVAANPMERFLVEWRRSPALSSQRQPGFALIITRLSAEPAVVGSGDLISLERLKAIYGEPTSFLTTYPHVTCNSPCPPSGPYPYFEGVWKKSNPTRQIRIQTTRDSSVSVVILLVE